MKSTEILLYEFGRHQSRIDVLVDNDTLWLSQSQMVQLFDKTKQNISLNINNCFKKNELDEISTVKYSLTVQKDTKKTI